MTKGILNAKYLGVLNWGAIAKEEILADGAKVQRFELEGHEGECLMALRQDPDFTLLNALMPGYTYRLTVENGEVTEAVLQDEIPSYSQLISGVPGLKTLRNLLTTACEPLGTVLYILGGGWDWQDDRPNIFARSIGVSGTWVRFFNEHNDGAYICKCDEDKSKAPYPYGGFNQFNALGLDCSGFVGWTIYNTFETENGRPEYSSAACRLAKGLDQIHHLGIWHPGNVEVPGNYLEVGDVVSTDTHVWFVIGRCADGSVLLIHSTSGNSYSSNSGGVQLSALQKDGSKDCDAFRLADNYMKKYYPGWASVREALVVNYERSTRFTKDTCGRFSWDLSGPLTDPDGFHDKSPEEILKIIFNE